MVTRRAMLKMLGAITATSALPVRVRSASNLSFLALGDWGEANSSVLADIARQMASRAAEIDARFIVTTGDNFYPYGVASTEDPLWQSAFQSVFKEESLQRPWFPVLGNHDWRGNVEAELAYGAIDPRWTMPARYYSRSVALPSGKNIDFFHLDTNSLIEPGAFNTFDVEQLEWLSAGLASSIAAWKIVIGHHPVYSGGKHGDTERLVEALPAIFSEYDVQLYLNGHDHDVQHIVRNSTSYVTCGAASSIRPTRFKVGTRYAAAKPGFSSIQIGDEHMCLDFVGSDGSPLYTANIPRS